MQQVPTPKYNSEVLVLHLSTNILCDFYCDFTAVQREVLHFFTRQLLMCYNTYINPGATQQWAVKKHTSSTFSSCSFKILYISDHKSVIL